MWLTATSTPRRCTKSWLPDTSRRGWIDRFVCSVAPVPADGPDGDTPSMCLCGRCATFDQRQGLSRAIGVENRATPDACPVSDRSGDVGVPAPGGQRVGSPADDEVVVGDVDAGCCAEEVDPTEAGYDLDLEAEAVALGED